MYFVIIVVNVDYKKVFSISTKSELESRQKRNFVFSSALPKTAHSWRNYSFTFIRISLLIFPLKHSHARLPRVYILCFIQVKHAFYYIYIHVKSWMFTTDVNKWTYYYKGACILWISSSQFKEELDGRAKTEKWVNSGFKVLDKVESSHRINKINLIAVWVWKEKLGKYVNLEYWYHFHICMLNNKLRLAAS